MRIPAMPFLASLDHLVLTVSDLQRTLDFYCGVLGCEEVTFGDKRKAIRFGDQKINLHVKGNEIVPHALCPAPGSADLCFLSTVPVAALAGHFKAHGIAVELGPVERTGATGNLLSIYVRDPDGNLIEIANRKRPAF
jgi:catechol 2,3-dioxygenase-like lactoylglutathione lyase family enzyme